MSSIRLRFDRGTLLVDGDIASELPSVVWDERVGASRAPAYRYRDVLGAASERVVDVVDEIGPAAMRCAGTWRRPELRPYQDDALRAFRAADRRGLAGMPTGSGKTVLAIAAMAEAAGSALVLCPTRALLGQWAREVARWYSGPIGVVGDGERSVEAVTVMTFESAFRVLDEFGARFSMLVVDEAHHFGSGHRAEALEMCVAPVRLGLSATAPTPGGEGAKRLAELIGPAFCEIAVTELMGTHLAELEIVRLGVRLGPDEAHAYVNAYEPFAARCAAFFREHPRADWTRFVRTTARTAEGRRLLAAYRRAVGIAAFPAAKRALLGSLLARHRDDKCLVFTSCTDDAYAIGAEHLVPVITAHTTRAERDDVLDRFRAGTYRTLVSACVLNEGIDVPDARVAFIVGGRFGVREHVQRIGRVLRPAPGKRAVVYELVTNGTIDDTRARRRSLVSGEALVV